MKIGLGGFHPVEQVFSPRYQAREGRPQITRQELEQFPKVVLGER